MLTSVYRLVRPRQFELVFKDITLDTSHVIDSSCPPVYLQADQRYYQGLRCGKHSPQKASHGSDS